MRFLTKTWEVCAWTAQVVKRLFRFTPVTTTTIVLCGILRRLSRMLAFLLPLKVILLASSTTVPRYFRPFVAPEHRDIGIVVLAGLAVFFYLLTLLLDALSNRLAARGGDKLMAKAVGMTVIHNQREEMTSYYREIVQIASTALFLLVVVGLLARIEPPVALHLVLFTAACLGITALALEPRADHRQTRAMTLITDDTGNYISILSSIAFLTGFLVILYPLFMGAHSNVLRSLIALTLFRQAIGSLAGMVRESRSLAGRRDMVDTLTSPEHRLNRAPEVVDGSLQELFGKARRQERFHAEMDLPETALVDMRWLDPTFRDANRFVVTVSGEGVPARHFEQHVYPARSNRPLANEALLFRHVERAEIFAPPPPKRFSYGPFECVVFEAGMGAPPPISAWAEIEKTVLMRLSCLQPAKALADAFRSSHLLLGERLSDAAIDKVRIAAETEEELALIAAFRARLPAVKDELNRMPLCLANPDFRPGNLNTREDGGFFIMNWGQWLIEPFGTRFSADWPDERLNEFIAGARRMRSDVPAWLTPDHVRLVDDCSKLERRLLKGTYRGALGSLAEVIARMDKLAAQAAAPKLKLGV